MSTTRPPRKTAIPPKAPPLAKGHKAAGATPFAATSRTAVPEKLRKTGARAPAAVRASDADSAQLVAGVRSGLGVTRELFARLTGFSVRAITDWEAGRPISDAGLRRVKELGRLRAVLAGGMREEFIGRWLQTPCEGLGGLKPVEVLERGEADRLWRVAFLIGSGMPT